MPSLFVALLVASSLPALLPRLRDALIGAGICLAVATLAFVVVLQDIDRQDAGEGPAFASSLLQLAAFQGVVGASFLGRLLAHWLGSRLKPVAAVRTSSALVLLALSVVVVALLLFLWHLVSAGLVVVAAVATLPLLWLGIALRLPTTRSSSHARIL